jgi:hypothetical protein
MDREQILARIDLLTQERDRLRSTLAAYDGAVQESNYWLKELDKPKEDPTDDSVSNPE